MYIVNLQGYNEEPKKFDAKTFFRKNDLKLKKPFYDLTIDLFQKKKLVEVMEGYGYDVRDDEFSSSFIPEYTWDYLLKNTNSFDKVNNGQMNLVLNLKNNTKPGHSF